LVLASPCALPPQHSFPTRRSSDLLGAGSATPGSDRQDFNFGVTASLSGGQLFYRDWAVVRGDGTGRLDTGRLISFTVAVCDNGRSEEHTSELQSRGHVVCRLLLEK